MFTSTTPESSWSATTYVAEPASAYVAALKEQPGGDLGIHGSLTLAQSLLRDGLVDEAVACCSTTAPAHDAGGAVVRYDEMLTVRGGDDSEEQASVAGAESRNLDFLVTFSFTE